HTLIYPLLFRLVHLRDPHSSPTRRSSDLGSTALRRRCRRLPRRRWWRGAVPIRRYRARRTSRSSLLAVRSDMIVVRSAAPLEERDRKSTRLNSSHVKISYAVFCLKKKNQM